MSLILSTLLVDFKLNLKTISCLAKIFLILCFLVEANHAGIIKKRDTVITTTPSGNLNVVVKEKEVAPDILSALYNASEVVTTKLQSVAGGNFVMETSKELTNNEIFINEAKENKMLNSINESQLKAEEQEETKKVLENKSEKQDEITQNSTKRITPSQENLQDFNKLILNLENKEQIFNESSKTTTEFSRNDIKVDKIPKLKIGESTQGKQDYSDNEHKGSLKHSLEIAHKTEGPHLSTTEAPVAKAKVQNIRLENSIENNKELDKSDFKGENKEENLKPQEEVATLKTLSSFSEIAQNQEKISKKESLESLAYSKELYKNETEIESSPLKSLTQNPAAVEAKIDEVLKKNSSASSEEIIKNEVKVLKTLEEGYNKPLESTTLETSSKPPNKVKTDDVFKFMSEKSSNNTLKFEEDGSSLKSLETLNLEPKNNKTLDIFELTTIVPLKHLEDTVNKKFLENSLNKQQDTDKIHGVLKHQELLQSNETPLNVLTTTESLLDPEKTTLPKQTQDEDVLLFEDDKKEYARSMFIEATTSLNSREINEVFLPTTTFKPEILGIKEGTEETAHEKLKQQVVNLNKTDFVTTNIKEKKPKFINDNSTNAQQLNLPNNAEVWSLAAMKSLPKANNTMETAQTHNQTVKEFMQNITHNVSMTINSNSEKNLLDWSQIMMDKELSTTTRRHEEIESEKEKQQIHLANKDKEMEVGGKKESSYGLEDTMEENTSVTPEIHNRKYLIQHEQTTSTISTPTTFTILSPANNNENDNQKNNQKDKKVEENMNNHKDTLTETLATTAPTIVNNNPFNATLNIEPNLNEINLTSNQTQAKLNNDVHNTTTPTTEKQSGDANAGIETNTAAAMTTEATAVVDKTTVEQISSETTPLSTTETSKQNTSLNNVVINQQQQTNKSNSVNLKVPSASHNELENAVLDKQKNQYDNSDLNTKTTTTVVPITTFRPTILAITSTTSIPATFEQEIDQNGNKIQTNLTNTEHQQSIIQTNIHDNNLTKTIETHLTEREFETTTSTISNTHETITTYSTAATLEIAVTNIENTLTSSLKNKTNTTTSFLQEQIINETTERNFELSETTTYPQTTPKQVDELYINTREKVTTIGSSVTTDNEKFEKKESETTTTENNFAITSTETPVVTETQGGYALNESFTPATIEKNIIATTTTTTKHESDSKEHISNEEDANIETTTMSFTQTITTSTVLPVARAKEEETYISLLDDTTTTTTQAYSPTTSTTATVSPPPSTTPTTTAAASIPPLSTSTEPSAITTKIEEIYNVIHSTTTELIQTTTQKLITDLEEETSSEQSSTSSTNYNEMLPPASTTPPTKLIGNSLPTLTSIMGGNSGNMYSKNSEASEGTDVNVIIAITVSVIGVISLILLVGFLYLMRKRQKQTSYSQRCRPVSLDEYTIDNASIGGSMRKSSTLRASKRTYGNLAFDDPSLRPNPLGVHELSKFVQEKLRIFEEFRDVPQITARLDEVPTGCEDKNRYANVLPLPETRIILQRLNDDEKTEYINANYVTGPKDLPNYYIACQAPLETTVEDFWRMIWEQQSRVIIQATDLIENGVEKCAEYLPPSVTLDNHSSFGDFQITLQHREVKDKYAISTILLKHVGTNDTRELTHYWYKWPEVGVPAEEAPIIAMLLEARSSLISYAIEQANEDKEKSSTATLNSAEEGTVSTTSPTNNSNISSANGSTGEINGNISMVQIKKTARNQGPLTIHCSPGTGRTGTIIACDIAIRSLETPKRIVNIPQIVYYVRRGRASAVLTKEQYEFIYKVANMYAAKISNPTNYN